MAVLLPIEEQVQKLVPLVLEYFEKHFREFPSLSSQAAQLMGMAKRVADAEVVEIVAVIQRDPTHAAEILRLANSVMYRRDAEATTLHDAIVRVGRREVYSVLMALSTRSLFEPKLRSMYNLLPEHWHRLQHHSVSCAFGTAWLAGKVNLPNSDEMFLAGMFHDIGKMIALFSLAGVIMQGKVDFEVSFQASAMVFEEMHCDLGKRMVIQWKLPVFLQDVCAKHHDAGIALTNKVLHAVRVVSCWDTVQENLFIPPTLQAEFDYSRGALNISQPAMDLIGKTLQEFRDQATALLGKNPAGKPAAK